MQHGSVSCDDRCQGKCGSKKCPWPHKCQYFHPRTPGRTLRRVHEQGSSWKLTKIPFFSWRIWQFNLKPKCQWVFCFHLFDAKFQSAAQCAACWLCPHCSGVWRISTSFLPHPTSTVIRLIRTNPRRHFESHIELWTLRLSSSYRWSEWSLMPQVTPWKPLILWIVFPWRCFSFAEDADQMPPKVHLQSWYLSL